MSPIVSIIVPCYLQAQYLSEALQSVLDQTYPHWECIIVNDGSTDSTEVVAKEWVSKDSRFIYIQKENGGLSSARNAGLDIAKGDYIQFLDADDCLDTRKFEKSLEIILSKNIDLIVSNFRMFTDSVSSTTAPFCELKSEYLTRENIIYNWDYLFSIPIHCGFFNKSFFNSFRFPLELKAKEDWIMWISALKNDPECFYSDEVLCFYRLHDSSMTKDKREMKSNYYKAILYLKTILNDDEFDRFYLQTIVRLESQAESNHVKYQKIKQSNSFKLGSKFRYYLKKIGLLNLVKYFLLSKKQ